MATAIFVGATIVRMVLVPAIMQLLGPANCGSPTGWSGYCPASTSLWRRRRARECGERLNPNTILPTRATLASASRPRHDRPLSDPRSSSPGETSSAVVERRRRCATAPEAAPFTPCAPTTPA
jgi:hypothetical protein